MAENNLPIDENLPTEVVENEIKVKDVKNSKFINPFDAGVTYEDFLKSIPKGKTVEEYCDKKIEANQLEWLLVELEHFKNNKQTK